MNRAIVASSTALVLSPLVACASHESISYGSTETSEQYRVSVEIPLDEMRFEESGLLKVNELLDARTEFAAEDFQLDEVVLIARAEDEAEGHAELLVLEWRSGEFEIPAGDANEWYEVRIPAPEEDPGGAWLLDIAGDVTIDLLVAVLEPRLKVVEQRRTYRTRTVYRTRGGDYTYTPTVGTRVSHAFWIYDPVRYYVYHHHDGIWPYRYFVGTWDYRRHPLGYRPHRHYHSHRYDRRHRYRPGRDAVQAAAPARLKRLERIHPRLRTFYRQDREPRAAARSEASDDVRQRYEEAKRTHPRLRAFHRNKNGRGEGAASTRRTSPSAAVPATSEQVRPGLRTFQRQAQAGSAAATSRENGAAVRAAPRPASADSRRAAQARTDPAPVPGTVRKAPSVNARARVFNRQAERRPVPARTAPRQAPTARSTPSRVRAPSGGNVRTRVFERPPSAPTRAAPRQAPPVRNQAPRLRQPGRANAPAPPRGQARRQESRPANPRLRAFERQSRPPSALTRAAPRPAPPVRSMPSQVREPSGANSRTRTFERQSRSPSAPPVRSQAPRRRESSRASAPAQPRRQDAPSRQESRPANPRLRVFERQ